MPRISYQARTLTGEIVEGRLNARDVDEMRVTLSRRGMALLQFTEEPAVPAKKSGKGRFKLFKPVGNTEIAAMTGQLAILLETGTSLVDALDVLARQADNANLQEVLETAAADVRGGASLGEAFEAHPDVFDRFYISAVKTGESSGTLTEVFQRLEDDLMKRESVRSSVRAAMVYPAILTVLAVAAVIFMVTFVLPKFIAIFQQSGVELPLPTRALLTIASFTRSYWYLMLVVLALAVVSVRLYLSTNHGTAVWDTLILKIPMVGPLAVAIHSSMLLRMLATLLDAGVPLLETLTVAQSACANSRFKELVTKATATIMRGEQFARGVADTDLLTPTAKQMIATGEQTGTLPLVLSRLADRMDTTSDRRMKKLSTIVEPVIIIVMGAAIGFIAVSLLLPLFRLTAAVRRAG